MNKFQLEALHTKDLTALKNQISAVLNSRKKEEKYRRKLKLAREHEGFTLETDEEIMKQNSSGLFSIPKYYASKHTAKEIYLPSLINQNWSGIYKDGGSNDEFYVYAHVDPSSKQFTTRPMCGGNYGGTPFYIGKGSGDRAHDLKRNQGHGKKITELIKKGVSKDLIPYIIFSGLSESKAYELESKLIYFFGTIYNKESSKHGVLLNLDIPKTPNFISEMKEYNKPDRKKHKTNKKIAFSASLSDVGGNK